MFRPHRRTNRTFTPRKNSAYINLPLPGIWDKLVERYQLTGHVIDDKFVKILEKSSAKLSSIRLRIADIRKTESIQFFLRQNLTEFDLGNMQIHSKFPPLPTDSPPDFLTDLNEHGKKLKILSTGENEAGKTFATALKINSNRVYAFEDWDRILDTPDLEVLAVKNFHIVKLPTFLAKLVAPLRKLKCLDFSGCSLPGSLYQTIDFSCLEELPNFRKLILYNVKLHDVKLKSIFKLRRLTHLYISTNRIDDVDFNPFLESLVEELKDLHWLDISGRSLSTTDEKIIEAGTSIPALKPRSTKPFKFLGIYKCFPNDYEPINIPAEKIAGNFNKDQLLLAGFVNLQKPDMIISILEDLILKLGNFGENDKIVELTLEAVERFLFHAVVVLTGIRLLLQIPDDVKKYEDRFVRAILNSAFSYSLGRMDFV